MATTTATSTIQDRTSEFHAILRDASHRSKANPNSQRASLLSSSEKRNASPSGPTGPRGGGRSEFARKAADIGRGISGTMAKLERLAQLARRRALFDDKPIEINELTFVIKQDLAGLDRNIRELQVVSSGGAGAGAGSAKSKDQEGEHNKNVIFLLRGKLGDITTQFKDTLELRTKNIQASRSRTENFLSSVGAAAAAAAGTSPGGTPGRTDSPLYQLPQQSQSQPFTLTAAAQSDILSLDPAASSSALTRHQAGSSSSTSAQQMMMMEEGSNTYIQARGEAIDMIERTVAELGGIFTQLAQMVAEQGEQIQRIDADTEDVLENVDGAQRELLKYWHRVSGNRWLVAKMFGVLMVFFLLWVLIAG